MSVSGVVHQNPQVGYFLNNFLNGDPMYIGKVAGGNNWLIQTFSPSTGVMLYATPANNSGVNTYNDAWTARASLNYGQYQTVQGQS